LIFLIISHNLVNKFGPRLSNQIKKFDPSYPPIQIFRINNLIQKYGTITFHPTCHSTKHTSDGRGAQALSIERLFCPLLAGSVHCTNFCCCSRVALLSLSFVWTGISVCFTKYLCSPIWVLPKIKGTLVPPISQVTHKHGRRNQVSIFYFV
jgi:hypothetical protein